jgi:predicted dehydrogenase
MLAAYRNTTLRFGVMFQERSRPLYMKIKSMLQQGTLGDIRRVHWIVTDWFRSQAYYQSSPWRATWKGEGGGLLINQCPHNLDLLYWFMGLPGRVTAHIGLGKYHPIEVEDEVHAFLAYPNGATGVFVANTGEAPGTNRLEIVGEKGKLVLEQGTLTWFENAIGTSVFSRTTPELFARPACTVRQMPVSGVWERHAGVLKNFRDAIREGVPLLAPAAEAMGSLELGNAMLLSGLLERPVDLPLDGETMERELLRLAAGGRLARPQTVRAPLQELRGSIHASAHVYAEREGAHCEGLPERMFLQGGYTHTSQRCGLRRGGWRYEPRASRCRLCGDHAL